MARKFFLVCAGMLMLALSFYFGARSASAQAGINGVIISAWGGHPQSGLTFLTNTGDIYYVVGDGAVPPNILLSHYGNISGTLPTTTVRQSWGEVKQRYAKPGRSGASRGGADR